VGAKMKEMLKAISQSKSIEILLALQQRKLKFTEIVEIAGNPTTAMRRVTDLQRVGLISRRVLQDKKRSVEYSLTKKGISVVEFLERLKKEI
jgi:DNA-binding HxlR family transcriptional regulator